MAFYKSTVVTTGPTERQVEKVVWGELREAYTRAESRNPGLGIGGVLLPNSPELRSLNPDYPEKSKLPYDPFHFIQGFVGKSKEAYKGFHNVNVFVIVTEAQGVDPEAYVAIDQLATAVGNFKLLLVGNPTCEPTHPFYLSHEKDRAMYRCISLDSRKSSHCGKAFIDDIAEKYGIGSPMWVMCVEGRFVEDITDQLIPLSWIRAAQARWDTEPIGTETSLGLDVARFGTDFTTAYVGQGNRFKQVMKRHGQDLMETVGRTQLLADEYKVEPRRVRVDDTGLGGGVTDRLRELGKEPSAINFGSDASDKIKFFDARSEMAWTMRERFRLGTIAIDPQDRLLEADLIVLKWKPTSEKKLKLESKHDLKSRIGRSPDFADGLMLATLDQAVAETVAQRGKPNAGLLDFVAEQMRNKKPEGEKPRIVASSQSVEDLARQLAGQQPRVPGSWSSVAQ